MEIWNEGEMNTVVSQAIATGLPVVTTEHSGLPEQVLHGRNGMVVPEADVEALSEAIQHMIEHPELWPEYGRFGRSHALQNYHSKTLIAKQIEQYRSVVRGPEA
jgi:colanic acid/amylovoran biosynthesis glycosyltransferase